jgi:hypothetical protein
VPGVPHSMLKDWAAAGAEQASRTSSVRMEATCAGVQCTGRNETGQGQNELQIIYPAISTPSHLPCRTDRQHT